MRKHFTALALLTCAALVAGGCDMEKGDHHAMMWGSVKSAVAVLEPTAGNAIKGTILFEDMDGGVHITGQVSGLAPNSMHAMHIHEFGDITSDNGMAAGGHYNPEGNPHGDPMDGPHHAGDLGNITADGTGTAKIDEMIKGISVAGKMDPIIGRGLVVHAGADDMKTQPTGNAGARIAVGVIGIRKNP